jgi:hypothetical protein
MTPHELATVHQHDKTGSLPIVSRALIESEARVARLEEALRKISTYPITRTDELGAESMRHLARAALRETGGSE